MLIFADNTEFRSQRVAHDDIYAFGLVGLRRAAFDRLRMEIRSIKKRHLGDALCPLKWNLRDLRKHVDEGTYARLLDHSTEVRAEVLCALADASPVLVFSAVCAYSTDKKKAAQHRSRLQFYSFANGLERMALEVPCIDFVNPDETSELVMDWPDRNERADFCQGYQHAWSHGEIRFQGHAQFSKAGPLRRRRFLEAPRFAPDIYDLGVQCADLFAGLTREIWQSSLKDQQPAPWKRDAFAKLAPHFRRDKHGEVFQVGLVAKGTHTFEQRSKRVLTALVDQAATKAA